MSLKIAKSTKENSRRKRTRIESLTAFAFVLPALLIVIIVLIYPVLFNFNLSLRSWSLFDLPQDRGAFIWLENFQKVVTNSRFQNALIVTVKFMLGTVIIEYILGLVIALLLNSKFKGRDFFRTIFMLPMMMAPVVIAIQWKYLLSGSFGVINHTISVLGFNPPSWLSQPGLTLWTIIFVDVWAYVPFVAIILLAGLQNIPDDLYEAARVDGANPWQQILYITLPLLKPATILALLIRATEVFKTFELIYVLTGGGPADSTEVLGLFAYRVAFSEGSLGKASAIAVFIAIIGTVIGTMLIYTIKTDKKVI